MVNNVEQIQILLGKSLVSASPNNNIMNLTNVWERAITAQSELTKLPLSEATLYRTAKFLSQTGDYAHIMARKNSEGKVMTQKNRQQLQKLRSQSASLSDSLHKLEDKILNGKTNWREVVQAAKQASEENKPDSINSGFDDISEDLQKFPTLIYDGPFSDHITQAKPRGLKGGNITQNEAKKRAQDFVDFEDKNNNISITDSKSVKGKIPAYYFEVSQEGEKYAVDISKKGGHLVNMMNSRPVNSSRLSQKEAVDRAQEYLARVKYPGMEATYSEVNDNIASISLAYQPQDIIYYPDIIDVQVALDNGQILAVEALSYLMSHQKRDIEEPELSKGEVKELVSKEFDKIEEINLAVIPTDSLKEVLTYEIRGTVGEEIYLIYINADTGDEEQILRVVKDNRGTFAL